MRIALTRTRNVWAMLQPGISQAGRPLAGLFFSICSVVGASQGLGIEVQGGASQNSSTGVLDFNRDIRPILSDNCFHCHGQDGATREAGLRLDDRDEAISHGALLPQDSANSELIRRILSDDPDLMMPPPASHRQLSNEQKKMLERWVDQGAEYEVHWAFKAPERGELPPVRDHAWVKTPIDRFILAKIEKEGLAVSPEADRPTLIKRLYADLVGLPPTPVEIEAFVDDGSPEAYEKLVDSLMERPQYGERMALPWLDAARYADSNGFQQDGDTWQWMWRDWVVDSLNQNLPFDDFTVWQLAGDLLPEATSEQKVASGFNRNHMLNGEGGAIAEEQRFNILFDRMDTTSTVFLGLTMACAQCHDHKYDPITQKDYYRLMDAFNRVPESGTPQFFSSRIRVAAPFVELPTPEVTAQLAKFDSQISEFQSQLSPLLEAAYQGWRIAVLADSDPNSAKGYSDRLVELLGKSRVALQDQKSPDSQPLTEDEKKELEKALRAHFDSKVRDSLKSSIPLIDQHAQAVRHRSEFERDQMPRPMIMSDSQPRTTHILSRGDYLSPDVPVEFGTPAFLPAMEEGMPKNRLGFAQWLVSDAQPLTARVQINRMWQHFFHTGLLKTPEDFGVQSEFPLHKDLLDWLAVDFRENGWDMKRINRMIVLSSTYRQSSKFTPVLRSYDPENKFYARANRFRMPSLVLRDWALASGNRLDQRVGGKPVYPYQPVGVWESLAITKERDFTYPTSTGNDLYRRSIYTFWRRTVGPANMFDSSNRQTCSVKPSSTSTPLHALTTLNDPTWVEAARSLAERVSQDSGAIEQQLRAAAQRILCREIEAVEVARFRKAYEKQLDLLSSDPQQIEGYLTIGESRLPPEKQTKEMAALSVVCLLMMNLDEALTRL